MKNDTLKKIFYFVDEQYKLQRALSCIWRLNTQCANTGSEFMWQDINRSGHRVTEGK